MHKVGFQSIPCKKQIHKNRLASNKKRQVDDWKTFEFHISEEKKKKYIVNG